jgi:ATP-binding cassette subfamily B protein
MARALGRSLQLAYRAQPRLLVLSFVLIVGAWVPEALGALWLKLLADGATQGRGDLVAWASAGLAAAAVAGWLLRTVGGRVEMRFRDRATIEIEAHVALLQGTVSTLEHHERPEHLDRLELLRDRVFLLNHLYKALMITIGMAGLLVITIGLLVSIHPALVLVALSAVPAVVISSWRATVERRATEAAASSNRLSRHLFEIGTTPGPAKEVRAYGIEDLLLRRRRAAWTAWYAQVGPRRWEGAAWHALGWGLFALGYVGGVVFVAAGLQGTPGEVLLALAAGANLSRYMGVTVGQAEFLRWTIDASQRLVWLEDFARRHEDTRTEDVPARLIDGIAFEGVSFTYPGTDRVVLSGVDIVLPAGSVVALVGENGAGKTTLVKLLCRLYEPTGGRITVDGADLSRMGALQWRERVTGAFQDHFRFEYAARRTVGVGDLPRLDDEPVVIGAIGRAGAGDVVEKLPGGLDTQLGVMWTGGVEPSIGQWQKLALARAYMREEPLLRVLDEPTASLDAETEYALFQRYGSASGTGAGGITLLVSHRFSTVSMADTIIVLDGAHVAESGTHEELMAAGGLYAGLYEVQASAYR